MCADENIRGVLSVDDAVQYMVILFMLFLVQFALACACLALSSDQQQHVLRLGWSRASSQLKYRMQIRFSCCGFDNGTVNLPEDDSDNMGHPPCTEVIRDIYY